MSSDRTTRAKRRNLVAKHAQKFNKSGRHELATAYKRKPKSLQGEIESSLSDTLADTYTPAADPTERVASKEKKEPEKPALNQIAYRAERYCTASTITSAPESFR